MRLFFPIGFPLSKFSSSGRRRWLAQWKKSGSHGLEGTLKVFFGAAGVTPNWDDADVEQRLAIQEAMSADVDELEYFVEEL
jgi:hypothetical protein